ncbi:MAG: aminotransferase class I/II-fold pyridoxal phosphate-dependent enzyme, partial [Vicinamibacterales bacterium]|nr:aminotransferase class I/II-fold pyridoxal phosphate-dependent enzyme [Vicinamibacterales bacterium]
KYTANAGIRELRAAVAAPYGALDGMAVDDTQTIVTAGGKQALYNATMALFGPGDEVITHSPGWPTIAEQVRLAGAVPVVVRTHADEGFALLADRVMDAVTPRTRGIVVNSPCNPTGAVMAEDQMARLAEEAAGRGLWLVLDLCYEQLVLDGAPHALPRVLWERLPERTLLAGSTSKSYAMTGWRCGWAVGPADVIAACNAVQSHSTSNVSSVTQRAALAALTGPQACVAEMREQYRRRRDLALGWLAADPRLRCVKPAGAFYLFVDVGDLLSPSGVRTSGELAQVLLDEQHLALMAGEAFDAPGFLRISLASAPDRLDEGIRRLHALVAAMAADGRLRDAGR